MVQNLAVFLCMIQNRGAMQCVWDSLSSFFKSLIYFFATVVFQSLLKCLLPYSFKIVFAILFFYFVLLPYYFEIVFATLFFLNFFATLLF